MVAFTTSFKFAFNKLPHFSYKKMSSFSLSDVVSKLNEFAPLSLAEKWDNVGLIVEPYTPR